MTPPQTNPQTLREKLARAMFERESTGRTFWEGWGPDEAYKAQAPKWERLADACLDVLAKMEVSEEIARRACVWWSTGELEDYTAEQVSDMRKHLAKFWRAMLVVEPALPAPPKPKEPEGRKSEYPCRKCGALLVYVEIMDGDHPDYRITCHGCKHTYCVDGDDG